MSKFTWMLAIAAVLPTWGAVAQASEPVAASASVQSPNYLGLLHEWRCEADPFAGAQQPVCWDSPRDLLLSSSEPFSPAFELQETPEAYTVTADIPGVDEKDLEVTLTGSRLAIRGKRSGEKPSSSQRVLTRERSFGDFQRSFTLPNADSGERLVAQVDRGVLTVQVPKRPNPETKRIGVRATGEARMVVGSVP